MLRLCLPSLRARRCLGHARGLSPCKPFPVPRLHGGAAAASAPVVNDKLCQRGMLQPWRLGRHSSLALPDACGAQGAI